MSLFQRTSLTVRPASPLALVPKCGLCKLYEGCRSPKMKPTGKGKRNILVVGEAPGEDEDRRGIQFVGKTGVFIRDILKESGLSPDRDCTFTNALICRPPNNKIKDLKKIDYCRPNLLKTIEESEPEVILLLGAKSLKSLVGHLMNEDPKGIRRWAGFQIPCRKPNAWICPTFHPSYIMREEKKPNYQVLLRRFKDDIRRAVKLKGRPWKKVPDYKSQVQTITSPKVAAEYIRAFTANGEPVAFDYETNMLKPDTKRARIVTCGISDGATTVAYPWHGEAIKATKELLKSKVKKIGYNLPFENRWTKAKLGFWVNNFAHCGMNTAHGLDNRPGISGAKFQAFVLLGQEDYSAHIKPFLRSKEDGGNSVNRIDEVPLNDLLLYNGLDALVEYLIWEKQMEVLK